jgi:hypothetical protein
MNARHQNEKLNYHKIVKHVLEVLVNGYSHLTFLSHIFHQILHASALLLILDI